MKKRNILLFVLISTIAWSCRKSASYLPKPRIYPRIILPERNPVQFDKDFCRFTFLYPDYSSIRQDTDYFESEPADPCWFDIVLGDLNGRIHCTYYPIHSPADLEKFTKDAFKLAGKHNTRADFIDELPIHKPNDVSGMLFNIEGNVASPFQFYLTDSSFHFLRGALYFDSKVDADSLAPVLDFVKTDIIEIINSWEWVN